MVKIQPTAKHAETCFDAIKPYMPESTVLIIPDELKANAAPVINWVTFSDEKIIAKNSSGQLFEMVSGIFVTGNTYPARDLFVDKALSGGKESSWVFVREVNNNPINGWMYDTMIYGSAKADMVKSNLTDWAQTRGNKVIFNDGFGNDDNDQGVQTDFDKSDGCGSVASSSLDATEPRLEHELSEADNVLAVSAAVEPKNEMPVTPSTKAAGKRSRSRVH